MWGKKVTEIQIQDKKTSVLNDSVFVCLFIHLFGVLFFLGGGGDLQIDTNRHA